MDVNTSFCTPLLGCDSKISAYHEKCSGWGAQHEKYRIFFQFNRWKCSKKSCYIPDSWDNPGFWGPRNTPLRFNALQRFLGFVKLITTNIRNYNGNFVGPQFAVFLSEQTPWFPFGTWMTNTMMTALPETSFGWKMNVLLGPGLFSETVLVSGRVAGTKKHWALV